MILTAEETDSFAVRPSGRGSELIATVASVIPSDMTLDFYTLSGNLAATIDLGYVEPGASVSFPVNPDLCAGAYIAVANLVHTRLSAKLIIK